MAQSDPELVAGIIKALDLPNDRPTRDFVMALIRAIRAADMTAVRGMALEFLGNIYAGPPNEFDRALEDILRVAEKWVLAEEGDRAVEARAAADAAQPTPIPQPTVADAQAAPQQPNAARGGTPPPRPPRPERTTDGQKSMILEALGLVANANTVKFLDGVLEELRGGNGANAKKFANALGSASAQIPEFWTDQNGGARKTSREIAAEAIRLGQEAVDREARAREANQRQDAAANEDAAAAPPGPTDAGARGTLDRMQMQMQMETDPVDDPYDTASQPRPVTGGTAGQDDDLPPIEAENGQQDAGTGPVTQFPPGSDRLVLQIALSNEMSDMRTAMERAERLFERLENSGQGNPFNSAGQLIAAAVREARRNPANETVLKAARAERPAPATEEELFGTADVPFTAAHNDALRIIAQANAQGDLETARAEGLRLRTAMGATSETLPAFLARAVRTARTLGLVAASDERPLRDMRDVDFDDLFDDDDDDDDKDEDKKRRASDASDDSSSKDSQNDPGPDNGGGPPTGGGGDNSPGPGAGSAPAATDAPTQTKTQTETQTGAEGSGGTQKRATPALRIPRDYEKDIQAIKKLLEDGSVSSARNLVRNLWRKMLKNGQCPESTRVEEVAAAVQALVARAKKTDEARTRHGDFASLDDGKKTVFVEKKVRIIAGDLSQGQKATAAKGAQDLAKLVDPAGDTFATLSAKRILKAAESQVVPDDGELTGNGIVLRPRDASSLPWKKFEDVYDSDPADRPNFSDMAMAIVRQGIDSKSALSYAKLIFAEQRSRRVKTKFKSAKHLKHCVIDALEKRALNEKVTRPFKMSDVDQDA